MTTNQKYYDVEYTNSKYEYEPSISDALKHKAFKTAKNVVKKPLRSTFGLMQIGFISIIIYAVVLTNQGIDYKMSKPTVANAQTLTSQEFVQTAEIEPLKASDSEIPNKSDRATKLNNWIEAKQPNSPLNNANHDTGKILLEIESETKVKAEFILAKAYQETKLGTTGNCSRNVGSVGETDSRMAAGLRCQDFRSENQKKSISSDNHRATDDYLYKALRAIANTVNNKYLGNSTVLCQLARGYKGCTDEQIKAMNGKWYARNVDHSEALASILSDITGQSVDLQFSFKL
jgi:hypothetical protein